MFFSWLVLSCIALCLPHKGKRELVAVLVICMFLSTFCGFLFTTLPPGAEGGLRSLIVAFLGDFFFMFFYVLIN